MDDSVHTAVAEELSWYANGTLAAGRRVEVERHLAGCPACRLDLAAWGKVRDAVVAVESAAVADPEPDAERSRRIVAGVLARIDAQDHPPR